MMLQQPLSELHRIDFLALAESKGLQLLGALLILAVGVWLSRRLARTLDNVLGRAHVEVTLRGFLRNVAYAVMVIVVVVAALQFIGAPMASVFAVLGAAGLAIGLALKDSLSNIASGVMLIVQRPFHVGDHVQAANVEGTVEQVRVFQTRLRTADNRLIVLPNSLITTAPIINFTANMNRRVDLAVTIGYHQDLGQARDALLALARGHGAVLDDPAPEVLATGLAEKGVTLELRAWVPTGEAARARSTLTEAVVGVMIDKGLVVPAVAREVHILQRDGDAVAAPTGP